MFLRLVPALALKATREPQGIRDWAALREREAWGYRRYRHDAVKDRLAAGMDNVRPGAEALVLLPCDPQLPDRRSENIAPGHLAEVIVPYEACFFSSHCSRTLRHLKSVAVQAAALEPGC
jgi:hypothetical protein